MEPVDRDSLLLVGVCGPAHGVRGEVKVIPETDDANRLLALERVWVGSSVEVADERAVERARFQTSKRGLTVLLHLAGVASREAADLLRRQRVYALEADLPPADDAPAFLHDLHGLDVFAETDDGAREHVGTVADVIEGVAQDLLVVRRKDRPDALVPDVDAIVVDVNLDARAITLRPPEGLLD